MTIKPGEPYRAEAVAADDHAPSSTASAPSATPSPRSTRGPRSTAPTAASSLTLVADPQRRVYVRRINIAGNTRTRDEVIRREFRQFESSWYDGRKIKLSRDRVDRLGYFSEVNVDTAEVPGSADQVDLTVTIKEKPTGNLPLGAGFSSADKLSLTASIKQENVFGSGNYLGLEVNTSKYNRTLVLSTVDPYFTIDGISRAIDLYYRTQPADQQPGRASTSSSRRARRSASACRSASTTPSSSASAPSAPRSSGATQLPNSYFLYREQFGDDQQLAAADDRLDARQPRQRARADRGPLHARQPRLRAARRRQVLPRQLPGPAVHPAHARVHASASTPRSATARASAASPYPIFKNFYGGGLGTVRGFEQGSLGPVDVTGAFIGGNRALQHQQRALPAGAGRRQRPDAAHVRFTSTPATSGARTRRSTFDSLRASAGVGLSAGSRRWAR